MTNNKFKKIREYYDNNAKYHDALGGFYTITYKGERFINETPDGLYEELESYYEMINK